MNQNNQAMPQSPATGLSFSQALEYLKAGRCVARAGWNGKGMFIFVNAGSHDFNAKPDEASSHIESIRTNLFNRGDTGTATRLPNINMRAATGSTVTGWLASQTDLLAEDWCIAEPVAAAA
jgi:hypothetical protein